MICIDASFILRLITINNLESPYEQKWNEWQQSNLTVVAPTLLMYEVTNGLYKYHRAGQVTLEETEQLLEQALNLGIKFYGDAELHRQAFKIAQRYNLPATYDAHYLALAERLGVEFWTSDQRLFNTVQSSFSLIKLIS